MTVVPTSAGMYDSPYAAYPHAGFTPTSAYYMAPNGYLPMHDTSGYMPYFTQSNDPAINSPYFKTLMANTALGGLGAGALSAGVQYAYNRS